MLDVWYKKKEKRVKCPFSNGSISSMHRIRQELSINDISIKHLDNSHKLIVIFMLYDIIFLTAILHNYLCMRIQRSRTMSWLPYLVTKFFLPFDNVLVWVLLWSLLLVFLELSPRWGADITDILWSPICTGAKKPGSSTQCLWTNLRLFPRFLWL